MRGEGAQGQFTANSMNFCVNPKRYCRSLRTRIGTDYLPSPSEKDKMESVNSLGQLERDAVEEGFFACLPSLVKLMANIQDSGGKMFKVLLSEVLQEVCNVHHNVLGDWF